MLTLRARAVLWGILIFALAATAYTPALRGGFIWDDDDYVTDNPTLINLDGLGRIWLEFGATPQYYPLVHTTFWIEYHLWQLHPFGYHLTNVLLHAVNALLLWAILRRLAVPGAWLAAAIFAAHPVHVESVAWITERKNVLSGAFYLSSMLLYLRFAGIGSDRPSGRRRWVYFVSALLLFACALLSKSVTCTLPAALVLLLWWRRERLRASDLWPLIGWLAIGLLMGLTTVWMEKHHVGTRYIDWSLSPVDRCLIAGRAVWFYATKLLWPAKLTFFYPRWHIDAGLWWQYLFPLATVTVIAALWRLRRRLGKGPLVAVLLFVGTLTPALGFVDVYPMRFSFVADHFQYLASASLIALGAALLAALVRLRAPAGRVRWALQRIVPTALLLILATLSWRQTRIYHSLDTLWSDTVAKNPDAWMARYNLGTLRLNQSRLDEAVLHLQQAARLQPDYLLAHSNLGLALARQGHLDRAEVAYRNAINVKVSYWQPSHFAAAYTHLANTLVARDQLDEAVTQLEHALRLQPDSLAARLRLARVFHQQGNTDQAIAQYRLAARTHPQSIDAQYALATTLARAGRLAEAVGSYRRALHLAPDYAEAHTNLASALVATGQVDQAIASYQRAIDLAPDYPDPHYNLAWTLATSPVDRVRDGPRAVELARKACEMTDHRSVAALDVLAAAYAEAGQFDQALATAQQAARQAAASGDPVFADQIAARARLYQARRPYRHAP
jgi:tetratricopeptide (TPR) repeat protein